MIKGSLPSIPRENCKGKKKVTNDKILGRTIEKKYLSNKSTPSLEQKIKDLEEVILGMRSWAKLLLFDNPTLKTDMDKKLVTSQVTLQNNSPSTHPTFSPQIKPSSIQLLSKKTHIPNYRCPQYHAYAS